ncbi:MAG: RNA polymerase sigma factor [Psychroflexus sp.]|nr:RNA polymerase sigma factor [Psychroflexus sp.]MDN6309193.1 RNA polymerase sigma factor [Psychroflexus sp.]
MLLKKLIKQCQKNNIEAQKELYNLYAQKFFGIVLKYSSNYPEAQDNLQDAFIKIFEKIDQYKYQGSFEGWMKRILINTALQKYKKQKVYELIHTNIPDEPENVVIDQDLSLDELLNCIQNLPTRYRMVFNLYILDGYSHQEVADKLDISLGTSKSNLSRARQILRKEVELLQNINSDKHA